MMQLKLGHCQAFFSFLHNISIPPIAVLPLSENLSINSALEHFCRVVIIPVVQGIKSTVLYKVALCKVALPKDQRIITVPSQVNTQPHLKLGDFCIL